MCLCVCCLAAETWRGSGSGFPLHPAPSEESQVSGQKDDRFGHDGERLLTTQRVLSEVQAPPRPSVWAMQLNMSHLNVLTEETTVCDQAVVTVLVWSWRSR